MFPEEGVSIPLCNIGRELFFLVMYNLAGLCPCLHLISYSMPPSVQILACIPTLPLLSTAFSFFLK